MSVLSRPLTALLPQFSAIPVPKLARAYWNTLLRSLIKTAICFLGILNLGVAYDQLVGDGPLPQLNNGHSRNPLAIKKPLHFPNSSSTKQAALSTSLEHLQGVSPAIAQWVVELGQNGKIVFEIPPEGLNLYDKQQDAEILAAYRPLTQTLFIGPGFWMFSPQEQAAILAHEYRHSRQNWGKRFSIQAFQLLTAARFNYESILEEEAFAFEEQVRQKLAQPTP